MDSGGAFFGVSVARFIGGSRRKRGPGIDQLCRPAGARATPCRYPLPPTCAPNPVLAQVTAKKGRLGPAATPCRPFFSVTCAKTGFGAQVGGRGKRRGVAAPPGGSGRR